MQSSSLVQLKVLLYEDNLGKLIELIIG